MFHLETPLGPLTLVLLVTCLLCACGFEFVNGFHDTANAVATVIYTRTLKPTYAVLLSGLCNFLGVFMGGIAVAMGIIKLLPVQMLVQSGSGGGLLMVLSLLGAAITWNLGTWYLGIPASSSHTLIGSILGVGLAHSMLPGNVFGAGVDWHKASEVMMSLLVSPVLGFSIAFLLVLIAQKLNPGGVIHQAPKDGSTPPWWIRLLLVGTCSGVSFAHGSNDGQKGVGIIMLILMGVLPLDYALNPHLDGAGIAKVQQATLVIEKAVENVSSPEVPVIRDEMRALRTVLEGRSSMRDVPATERWSVRSRVLLADSQLKSLVGAKKVDAKAVDSARKTLRTSTDYAPTWVLIIVALSLGIGTTVGWKRIVVTVGEKIGKSHLTYAQGASAEIVAMSTISMASLLGLPVSTTHVLSSGIAGTMTANGSGVQGGTVGKIALAWVLTLPVCMTLSAALFLTLRLLIH